jgi:hypothetical protein
MKPQNGPEGVDGVVLLQIPWKCNWKPIRKVSRTTRNLADDNMDMDELPLCSS